MVAALVTLGVMAFLFAVLGVFYMKGNGVDMISMPEKRKAEWYEKELCRFIGRFMYFLSGCFLLLIPVLCINAMYLQSVVMTLMMLGVIYVVIRVFTPKRSKKNKTK